MKDFLLSEAKDTVACLRRKNKTVATAESCTGGLLSAYLTAVPGASAVIGLGVCAYSLQIKRRILGVSAETLERFGAVSRQTAREMAERVRALAGADIGVSVTGAAGPEPSEGKQPGTVYIALADASGTHVEKLMIEPESRNAVRRTAAGAVFALIRERLSEAGHAEN